MSFRDASIAWVGDKSVADRALLILVLYVNAKQIGKNRLRKAIEKFKEVRDIAHQHVITLLKN